MKIKKGFVLREVCGEHVIVGEGLGAVNFGKLLALNETAAWLWKQAVEHSARSMTSSRLQPARTSKASLLNGRKSESLSNPFNLRNLWS